MCAQKQVNDDCVREDWLNVVWNRWQGALHNPPGMSVLNAFRVYLTEKID